MNNMKSGESSPPDVRSHSGLELFLLTCMLLSFTGGGACLLFGSQITGIICMLAHGCLALTYLLVSQNHMLEAYDNARAHANELEMERSRLKDNSEKLAALQKEYDSCKRRLRAAETSLQELADDNRSLQAQLDETAETGNTNHLLPEPDEAATLGIIAVTNSVIQEMSSFCASSGIQVQLSTGSSEIPIQASKNYLRILFRNIIDNSVKYMQRSGSLVITISPVGSDLFIVLKDNGAGLPAQETTHIFELNYQGSNRISGNGLGLAQAKAIVEYYGGTIYAKSSAGCGMAIYIQLPAASHTGGAQ